MGLSFIYPVILNVIVSTLHVHKADLGAIRCFKNTVCQQLVTSFKIESEGLEESIPVFACLLDPYFKNIQFLAEPIRESAREYLQTAAGTGKLYVLYGLNAYILCNVAIF